MSYEFTLQSFQHTPCAADMKHGATLATEAANPKLALTTSDTRKNSCKIKEQKKSRARMKTSRKKSGVCVHVRVSPLK